MLILSLSLIITLLQFISTSLNREVEVLSLSQRFEIEGAEKLLAEINVIDKVFQLIMHVLRMETHLKLSTSPQNWSQVL